VAGAADKVRILYRRVFSRDPDPAEMDLALSFLEKSGTWNEYAQALLGSSEVIFLQ
jgi:hypothetical protein